MISPFDRRELLHSVERLTAGGGVDRPDDMVCVEDVRGIIHRMSTSEQAALDAMIIRTRITGEHIDCTVNGQTCEGLSIADRDLGDWSEAELRALHADIEALLIYMARSK